MSIMSDNLKKARKAIDGLTQEKAAKIFGVSRPRVGAWEEGRSMPPLSKFPKIVKLYNITDWVGFISDENFDPTKQKMPSPANMSFLEEQYKKLPKKLKFVVDELLKCY